jgi:ribosomal protein S12 methylthiotransferase
MTPPSAGAAGGPGMFQGDEMKLHLVSLGCARNLVDSEEMLGRLQAAGWSPTDDPAEAHVIVVNTCSFIEAAAEESIDTILEMARYKRRGVCRRLLVAGCLPERYREEIVATLPEVDGFIGTGAFDRIVEAVDAAGIRPGKAECLLPDPDRIDVSAGQGLRRLSTGPMAYLKIAEGCNRRCTYCVIPRLRGRQKSLPKDRLAAEAENLIASGVRELVLVAQETTAYGRDLLPPGDLGELLQTLAGIDKTVWIRTLYGHPVSITAEMIRTVAQHPNICPYFDIPVQHASPRILKRMGRNYQPDALYRLFEDIRREVAEAALRTTVIVGFPGESRDDFKQLVEFVTAVRFDHLGVFTYSDGEDLPSHRLDPHVSDKTAQRRRERLMEIQADISLENNRRRIGSAIDVLAERDASDGQYQGRTMFQAPEVDGVTFFRGKSGDDIFPGKILRVRITGAGDYDLTGVCD